MISARNFDEIDHDLAIPDQPQPVRPRPRPARPVHGPGRAGYPDRDRAGGAHARPARSQDWKALIQQARQAIFRRLALLGITDLEAHIKFETCFTPLSWRKRYNLVNGSTHGLWHNLMQLGYFRPGNRHARYHNLYFVGASTHPGTGMPTALISARLTARRMAEELV